MARPSKISCLPHELREQLNHRLNDGEDTNSLLQWLNGLPVVKALMAERFEGQPINEVNLSAWRHGGFHSWLLRQQALDFVADFQDEQGQGNPLLNDPTLVDKLVRWEIIYLACLRGAYPNPQEDPRGFSDFVHQFCVEVSRLRRDEFLKQRMDLEEKRVAFKETQTKAELNRLFWSWIKLPEVQAQLYPHFAEDTMRLIERDRAAAQAAAQKAAQAATAANSPPPQQKAA